MGRVAVGGRHGFQIIDVLVLPSVHVPIRPAEMCRAVPQVAGIEAFNGVLPLPVYSQYVSFPDHHLKGLFHARHALFQPLLEYLLRAGVDKQSHPREVLQCQRIVTLDDVEIVPAVQNRQRQRTSEGLYGAADAPKAQLALLCQ